MDFKVFMQVHDNTFVQIALTSTEHDADLVLSAYPSGMVTRHGVIMTTKNLKSDDTPTLPITI